MAEQTPFNTPETVNLFLSSLLTFKDDFPNTVRSSIYVSLIIFSILTLGANVYLYYQISSMQNVIETHLSKQDSLLHGVNTRHRELCKDLRKAKSNSSFSTSSDAD